MLIGDWIISVGGSVIGFVGRLIKLALATSTTCIPATNEPKNKKMIIVVRTVFLFTAILFFS